PLGPQDGLAVHGPVPQTLDGGVGLGEVVEGRIDGEDIRIAEVRGRRPVRPEVTWRGSRGAWRRGWAATARDLLRPSDRRDQSDGSSEGGKRAKGHAARHERGRWHVAFPLPEAAVY